MCVLYVSFGSKVRPRTFGCVAMGSAVLFILRSRLLLYSAWSASCFVWICVLLIMGVLHLLGNFPLYQLCLFHMVASCILDQN